MPTAQEVAMPVNSRGQMSNVTLIGQGNGVPANGLIAHVTLAFDSRISCSNGTVTLGGTPMPCGATGIQEVKTNQVKLLQVPVVFPLARLLYLTGKVV